MSTPQRWAIRDAGIAHFYNISTGKLVVSLPTLKTSGVEFTGSTVYSRGGSGNPKLVGFSGDKEGKMTLQDAIFDNKALAMLTGSNPIIGKQTIGRNDVLTVSGGKITLSKTPKSVTNVFVYNQDGTNGEELTLGGTVTASTYTIIGKEITVDASHNGKRLRVYYRVETAADTTAMTVNSDIFGSSFRIELECQVVDEQEKKTYKAQIQIPNAKFEENWNLSLAADGDPAVLDLSLEILKPADSTEMYKMVIYDDATIA